jgi:hypothetical protein
MLGRFTRRENRPPSDTTVKVATSEQTKLFELEIGDRVGLRLADQPATGGRLDIPSEAPFRLTGRPAAHRAIGSTPRVP